MRILRRFIAGEFHYGPGDEAFLQGHLNRGRAPEQKEDVLWGGDLKDVDAHAKPLTPEELEDLRDAEAAQAEKDRQAALKAETPVKVEPVKVEQKKTL